MLLKRYFLKLISLAGKTKITFCILGMIELYIFLNLLVKIQLYLMWDAVIKYLKGTYPHHVLTYL